MKLAESGRHWHKLYDLIEEKNYRNESFECDFWLY